MTTFTGTTGNDTANANNGTLIGFSGGSVAELQDAIGDFIVAGDGDDTVKAGSGNDNIQGGDGTDILEGGDGDDFIYASIHNADASFVTNDLLKGGRGDDLLKGSDGDNTINGGKGTDTLIGKGGEDSFVFDTVLGGSNVDTVIDFEPGVDRIVLDHDVFANIIVDPLDSASFHVGSAAHDDSDRIIYNDANGKVFYDADGTGPTGKVLFAIVDPGLAITHTDFDVV